VHELSLCQDLLEQVTAIAQTHKADTVVRIIVWIGPLSGVEPLLLKSAFDLIRAGGVADQAELVLQNQAVKVVCSDCGMASEATANNLLCRHCGSGHTRLIGGDELILARVELAGVA